MKTDLIIFTGQSNMVGQSEAPGNLSPAEGCREYKWMRDALVPLCDPCGENIRNDYTEGFTFQNAIAAAWRAEHVVGAAAYGYTTLLPAFCKAYREKTGHEVAAVHVARGAAQVSEFLPGTALYDTIVKKAQAAIDCVKRETELSHVLLVWLQGESDAIYKTTLSNYKTRLTAFKDALMKDLPIERFCVIRVGVYAHNGHDEEIIQAQDELCREDQDFAMLTRMAVELNQHEEYMNPNAPGHFSVKGLNTIGEAAGTALAELMIQG